MDKVRTFWLILTNSYKDFGGLRDAFKVDVRVRFRLGSGLGVGSAPMGRFRIKSWEMRHAYESPQKDRNTGMCV